MNHRQIQKRLNTIMGKLDEVISDTAGTDVLDNRDSRRLSQARELILSVESALYSKLGGYG